MHALSLTFSHAAAQVLETFKEANARLVARVNELEMQQHIASLAQPVTPQVQAPVEAAVAAPAAPQAAPSEPVNAMVSAMTMMMEKMSLLMEGKRPPEPVPEPPRKEKPSSAKEAEEEGQESSDEEKEEREEETTLSTVDGQTASRLHAVVGWSMYNGMPLVIRVRVYIEGVRDHNCHALQFWQPR